MRETYTLEVPAPLVEVLRLALEGVIRDASLLHRSLGQQIAAQDAPVPTTVETPHPLDAPATEFR